MAESDRSARRILTKREAEVLRLIARGMTSSEAARALFLSKKTVDYHLSKIYTKLRVSNRIQAFREVVRLKAAGLAPFDELQFD